LLLKLPSPVITTLSDPLRTAECLRRLTTLPFTSDSAFTACALPLPVFFTLYYNPVPSAHCRLIISAIYWFTGAVALVPHPANSASVTSYLPHFTGKSLLAYALRFSSGLLGACTGLAPRTLHRNVVELSADWLVDTSASSNSGYSCDFAIYSVIKYFSTMIR
jgi:hypothetical protein